jgi:hypothetical protein
MTDKIKCVKSPEYSYIFRPRDGFFMRWGKTPKDDPDFSPIGPEIADIEISTVCDRQCSFCYKSNGPVGRNMSFETFKHIFHLLPKNLTQIAFGIGSLDGNPELYDILGYCRTNDYNQVVPNITINGQGLTDYHAGRLAEICGAVAVSRYNSDTCYDAVQKLSEAGVGQVNIHQLLCENTYSSCLRLLEDYKSDSRLNEHLRAMVFLLMKPKGERNWYRQLKDFDAYRTLVNKALEEGIPIGFDSCSAPTFLQAVKGHENEEMYNMVCEPCESDCFSSYINVDARYFHCSFTEGEDGWEGINLLEVKDFMKEVWNHPEVLKFRGKLMVNQERDGCRSCPIFDLSMG